MINMADAPCPEELFQCHSGECIQWVFVCDDKEDCHDASDEYCNWS